MTTQKISVMKSGDANGAWVNHGESSVIGIYADERSKVLVIASYENGDSIPKLAVSLSGDSNKASVQIVGDSGVVEKDVDSEKFARAVDRFLAELADMAQ